MRGTIFASNACVATSVLQMRRGAIFASNVRAAAQTLVRGIFPPKTPTKALRKEY